MDKKFERMEKKIEIKIEEKMAGLETRIRAMEKERNRRRIQILRHCTRKDGIRIDRLQSSIAWIQNRKQRSRRESHCHASNQSHWDERRTNS